MKTISFMVENLDFLVINTDFIVDIYEPFEESDIHFITYITLSNGLIYQIRSFNESLGCEIRESIDYKEDRTAFEVEKIAKVK